MSIYGRGRGALILRWSRIVKFCGALSSENAGISNHKTGENPVGRKSKVSRATVIVPGLVGPKPRRISVGDGHQVNIPEQVIVVKNSRYVTGAVYWYITVQISGELLKSESSPFGLRFWVKCWLEKFVYLGYCLPYRKPTQVLGSSRPRPTRELSLRNSAKKRP